MFAISNSHFGSSAPEVLKNLLNDQQFSDVTLVSGDGKQISAHKVILGSSSSFFNKILMTNPHQNPLLFLKGVSYVELQLLKNFIYMGECQCATEDIEQFIALGKELEVVGLMDQETTEKKEKPRHQGETVEVAPLKNEIVAEVKIEEVSDNENISNDVELFDPFDSSMIEGDWRSAVKEEGRYPCDQCDYRPKKFKDLRKHKLAVHEKVKFDCDQCDYRASNRYSLKEHKKSIHEGVKYYCDQCDYSSSWKTHLNKHRNYKHGGWVDQPIEGFETPNGNHLEWMGQSTEGFGKPIENPRGWIDQVIGGIEKPIENSPTWANQPTQQIEEPVEESQKPTED